MEKTPEELLKENAPQDRTETQIMGKRPSKVMLGSRSYEIKPKSINDSTQWKEQLVNRLAPVLQSMEVKPEDPEGFAMALQGLLIQFPAVVIDLVCEWNEDIKKDIEKIKEEASEQEMVEVFMTVLGLAFPFSFALGLVQSLVKSIQQSEPSMSSSSQSTD